MAAEEQTPAGEEDSGEGPKSVFGNLPQTRPGARSPRRDMAAARRRDSAAEAAADPAPEPPAGSAEEPAADDPFAPPPDPAQEEAKEGGGGVEDIAWAGVAAAAEAATIGVRLATRALEAMRDAAGRR